MAKFSAKNSAFLKRVKISFKCVNNNTYQIHYLKTQQKKDGFFF